MEGKRIEQEKLLESKTLIVILGPTASGKTGLSLELAELGNFEVISADSRQIFKKMDIGTAKPTKEEMGNIIHHFIDILMPDEYYSAGIFGEQANSVAEKIFSSGKLPLLVGGSGLYIQALCEGFFKESDVDDKENIKQEVQKMLDEIGKDALYEKLIEVDPEAAKLYPDKNPRRITRALEHYYSTGKLFSQSFEKTVKLNDFKPVYFGINHDRQVLYDRINKRTEIMWEMGLEGETSNLLNSGFSPKLNSLNTIGYKECIAYLNGVLTKDQAIEKMQKNTRNFAKRQLTWFRRNDKINWVNGIQDVINILKFI